LIAGTARAEPALVGVASVIDGDTIEIHGQHVRLQGIDAPERAQTCVRLDGEQWRCGQAAAFALADHIERAVVRCEAVGTDHYGRALATCFKDTEDLNRWLVSAGFAVAYRRYSLAYVEAEDSARLARLGIWSGAFEMPWQWRAEHRH
jgi:endonuclease YncB( thermonuclease family)